MIHVQNRRGVDFDNRLANLRGPQSSDGKHGAKDPNVRKYYNGHVGFDMIQPLEDA